MSFGVSITTEPLKNSTSTKKYHVGQQFENDVETIVDEIMVLEGEDQLSLVAFILLRS